MKEEIVLNETAVRAAIKIIRQFEGCNLVAYPDPGSELYKELSKHNILRKCMRGEMKIPDYMLEKYEGKPWTIGFGETKNIKYGDVWTQEQADKALDMRAREFMKGVLKDCPQLKNEPYTKVAACTSLAYNIGNKRFAESTVCKKTQVKDYKAAAEAFLWYNKSNGQISQGLINRRKVEKDLFMSVVV